MDIAPLSKSKKNKIMKKAGNIMEHNNDLQRKLA